MSVELRVIADVGDGHDAVDALTRGVPGWYATGTRGPYPCRDDASRERWYLTLDRLPEGAAGLAVIVEDALSQT